MGDSGQAMHNHYLPQFLLRGFDDGEGLWQFDIHTGNLERRSVEKAGQRRHFYSVKIETGLLQRIDSEAGAIFSNGLFDKRGRCQFSREEHWQLCRWLALFAMRTPETFEHFKAHVEQAKSNPEQMVDVIRDDPARYVQFVKESIPRLYTKAVQELGSVEGEAVLVAAAVELVRTGRVACS
jgi:hypothetical protein